MSSNFFKNKDKEKFRICNRLISDGCVGSSSFMYKNFGLEHIQPKDVNKEFYLHTDIVGISVNGKRPNRLSFNKSLLRKASEANVTFVTDSVYDAERNYNIGEREVAEFLTKELGYVVEISDNIRRIWVKKA